jgi:mannose-6-phosphate isomerase
MAETGHSPTSDWAPFRVEPYYDPRVWGFNDLRPWYSYVGAEPIGEVWLTGDQCIVATGPHAGKPLGALFSEASEALLGPGAPSAESPLLIKVIFAREKLSVQVHPDDTLARKFGEPHGKTECWYVLSADPGAQVAVGLKPGVTLDQVREEIHSGTLEESLNPLPISAGDVVLMDAGTVHAIWPGSILLETQQNSDLTYRLYDYGRPRELHIEKGLEAVRLTTRSGRIPRRELVDRTLLIDEKYFRLERFPVSGSRSSASLRADGDPARSLAWLFAAGGAGRITGPDFQAVDLPVRTIAAVPAASPEFAVEDLGGLDLIRITPHWPGVTP